MWKKHRESDVPGALRHIAFIMDGNGRWAAKRHLPREVGHRYGVEAFRRVLKYCAGLGLECITVYAFSTENWKRPEHEVNAILELLNEYLDKSRQELIENRLHVRFIGDLTPIDQDLKQKIEMLDRDTAEFSQTLNIALNYGGRNELVHAANALIAEGNRSITEEDLSSHLYTAGCPDPDLIVRTGGEQRLSNFLLWQAAYAEFYFTDVLWPDLTEKDIDRAIEAFRSRKRRYGGV